MNEAYNVLIGLGAGALGYLVGWTVATRRAAKMSRQLLASLPPLSDPRRVWRHPRSN